MCTFGSHPCHGRAGIFIQLTEKASSCSHLQRYCLAKAIARGDMYRKAVVRQLFFYNIVFSERKCCFHASFYLCTTLQQDVITATTGREDYTLGGF